MFWCRWIVISLEFHPTPFVFHPFVFVDVDDMVSIVEFFSWIPFHFVYSPGFFLSLRIYFICHLDFVLLGELDCRCYVLLCYEGVGEGGFVILFHVVVTLFLYVRLYGGLGIRLYYISLLLLGPYFSFGGIVCWS